LTTSSDSTRPYLATSDRRRQLLDAASRVFARGGYAGMTMAALADEAQVSRRLVYNHFPNLSTLYEDFFIDRASRYLAAIAEANAVDDGDLVKAFERTFNLLLEIPSDDFRAVRLVFSDTGLTELDEARERLRKHIESQWMPRIQVAGFDEPTARARLWAMVGALFGLSELVSRSEVSIEIASATATALVVGMRQSAGAAKS
jgi:AcrR family transcriptional regulator